MLYSMIGGDTSHDSADIAWCYDSRCVYVDAHEARAVVGVRPKVAFEAVLVHAEALATPPLNGRLLGSQTTDSHGREGNGHARIHTP